MPEVVIWALAALGGVLLFIAGILAGIALAAPRWRQ